MLAAFSTLEIAVGAAVLALLVALTFPRWQGYLTYRRLQNAAYLLAGDLRLAQQMAIASGGDARRVEVCFRADGYDVYPVLYQDPIARTGAVVGPAVKVAYAGAEYASGVGIAIPDLTAAVSCALDGTRQAVAFGPNGAPLFADAASHALVLTLGGRTRRVLVEAESGLVRVGD